MSNQPRKYVPSKRLKKAHREGKGEGEGMSLREFARIAFGPRLGLPNSEWQFAKDWLRRKGLAGLALLLLLGCEPERSSTDDEASESESEGDTEASPDLLAEPLEPDWCCECGLEPDPAAIKLCDMRWNCAYVEDHWLCQHTEYDEEATCTLETCP